MLALGAGLLAATGPAARPNRSGKSVSRAGILRVNLSSDVESVDPALAESFPAQNLEYATCLKLLNYSDAAGPAGWRLVPEAATGLPRVSNDGKTFTFHVRAGLRFSDGEPLTAANFAYALQRDLNPSMKALAADYFTDIVGAQALLDGKANRLSGVSANHNTLTIHLTGKPSNINSGGDFLARIATPNACAIPTDLPIASEGVLTLPSAGPYYVASHTPGQQIVLKRNPFYKGPRPHRLSEIIYTIGAPPEQSLQQIEADQADWDAYGVTPSAAAALAQRYGINKSQFHVNPTYTLRYLILNTARPLFANTNLRRAVNYAIDRPALLRVRGALAGRRTSHYLPAGIPGSIDREPYPLGGVTPASLGIARRLADGHGGNAVLYIDTRPTSLAQAQIIQYDLRKIDINVEIEQFALPVLIQKVETRGEPFDMALVGGWAADYPDPWWYINPLLNGTTIGLAGNYNMSYFNSAKYNKAMQIASHLSGNARYQAYGRLDQDIAQNAAPLIALSVDNEQDFISTSFGGFLYQPVYGVDLAAAYEK
jgi:peptide/nickel transport system substrate-binding protein